MDIKNINIGDLNPSKYNPRKISKKAMKGLKASIKKFGYCDPIIINDNNTVIGGHQRLKALIELGINHAQVVVLSLNKIDEKALNIALNSQYISGEFDMAILEGLLEELKVDFDGFEDLDFHEFESCFEDIDFESVAIKEDNNEPKSSVENECPKCGYKW